MSLAAVLRPRAGGKTQMLGEYATTIPDSLVIVATQGLAIQLVHRFPTLKDRVLTVSEVKGHALKGRNLTNTTILIDDLDYVLPMLLGISCPDYIIAGTGQSL